MASFSADITHYFSSLAFICTQWELSLVPQCRHTARENQRPLFSGVDKNSCFSWISLFTFHFRVGEGGGGGGAVQTGKNLPWNR